MVRFPHDLRAEYIHGQRYADMALWRVDNVDGLCALASQGNPKRGIVWCKSDFLKPLFQFKNMQQRYVLVSGRSDHPIDDDIYSRKPEWVAHWFGCNKNVDTPDVTAIPCGMESKDSQGRSWDINVIEQQIQKPRELRHLCYMNISRTTNPAEREPVYQWGIAQDWIYSRDHDCEFPQFIADMHASKFVISPPGNGIESIRTWEAIYTGSIPIVKSTCNNAAYDGLPVLIVDSYESLTRESLEHTWKFMCGHNWDYSRATIGYWQRVITSRMQQVDTEWVQSHAS